MIYTVTLNPSLDYIAYTSGIRYGMTNRSHDERIIPGGKGLNVSIVLKRLGEETTAIAFTGGFTGTYLWDLVSGCDVGTDFIDVPGSLTRINVKMVTDCVTEMNGSGIEIGPKEKEALLSRLKKIRPDDLLVLSGTLPRGVDAGFYADLMREVSCPVVLDTNGEALTSALSLKPLFIKPNAEEIGQIFGIEHPSLDDIRECAKKLQEMGAVNVLVSLGKDGGALLLDDGTFVSAPAPKAVGSSGYTVGAGDSMVAGFIHALKTFDDPLSRLKYALAAGTASVVSDFLARKETLERLFLES